MRKNDPHLRISAIDVWPIDIPITNTFRISQGSMNVARNAYVSVSLDNGCIGYGEIAPFPEITGEAREDSLAVVEKLAEQIIGRSVLEFRSIATHLKAACPGKPAARCGIETAVVDALARALGIPLWALWGGAAVAPHETDITIPIAEAEDALRIADHWHRKGFRVFKVKVGESLQEDQMRLEELEKKFADISFIVDANQGYSLDEALEMAKFLRHLRCAVQVFEQPIACKDFDGMRHLRGKKLVPIAADEMVVTLEDAKRVVDEQAADAVNLKISKSGVIETMNIALFCRANGLDLMIGGMVESRVAMGCSFSLVLGLGVIKILDLDTPLLMSEDPVEGGYRYDCSSLIPWTSSGLGVRPRRRGNQ